MTTVPAPPYPFAVEPFGPSAPGFTVDLPALQVFEPVTPHSAEDYLRQAQALLPHGPAWTRAEGANLTALLLAEGDELARVERRALDLLVEANPATTKEMLADWERVCGLPDACYPAGPSIEERGRAVLVKLNSRGGASRRYFAELLASLGWTVEIVEHRPFRAGLSRAGDALTNGGDPDDEEDSGWRHVWTVRGRSPVFQFRAGQGTAGDPLRAWGDDPLECLVNRLKPAHTLALFDFSAGFEEA